MYSAGRAAPSMLVLMPAPFHLLRGLVLSAFAVFFATTLH
jgi:hypothetical protein